MDKCYIYFTLFLLILLFFHIFNEFQKTVQKWPHFFSTVLEKVSENVLSQKFLVIFIKNSSKKQFQYISFIFTNVQNCPIFNKNPKLFLIKVIYHLLLVSTLYGVITYISA
ncbi:unnamed protein product [Meganyctiphanes norvegica]|uniref:Uncharacterized protein n=1 Tax=Meganyctiphanes norvegica TaxID=48144 RepID=A0AAV2RUU5_MEGNR